MLVVSSSCVQILNSYKRNDVNYQRVYVVYQITKEESKVISLIIMKRINFSEKNGPSYTIVQSMIELKILQCLRMVFFKWIVTAYVN